jgi:hypothetical protein
MESKILAQLLLLLSCRFIARDRSMPGSSHSKKVILTDEARVLKRLRLGNGLSLH